MRENTNDPIPEVQITGNNYEVKGFKLILSHIIGYARLVCFALLFAGDTIFNLFGGL